MDYIHIDNLIFNSKHGFYAKERRVEQEFVISVKIGFDTSVAGKSDDLNDTLDYQKIKEIITTVMQGSSRYLIEKLAEDCATEILKDGRVHSVELSIKKTAVWDNGVPGITILRTRAAKK